MKQLQVGLAGFFLFSWSLWAVSLSYQYDVDGRLVRAVKNTDFSEHELSPAHNVDSVLTMGDANTNRMPDSLEAYLSGMWGPDYDPFQCDSDGDGVCDWNEWMLGTDPFSADSRFAAWNGGSSGGGGPLEPYDYTIYWPSVPFKTYTVKYMWDLTDGTWITGAIDLPATPPVNSWTHEDITNSHAFYRILTDISTNTVQQGGGE